MSRIESIQKMLLDDPQDSFLLFALAKEFESASQSTEAISTYESLRDLHPDYVGLYYHLAHQYQELDKIEQAISIYEQGMAVAQKLGDQHALSELQNAKLNLEIELDI